MYQHGVIDDQSPLYIEVCNGKSIINTGMIPSHKKGGVWIPLETDLMYCPGPSSRNRKAPGDGMVVYARARSFFTRFSVSSVSGSPLTAPHASTTRCAFWMRWRERASNATRS